MNCGYGEKLILYFYGEADAPLKAAVESHLAGCAACRGELAALQGASAWLAGAGAAPSAAAVEAVMLAARAEVSRKTDGFVFNLAEALLAGALAAVMAGVFAFSGQPAGPELAWNSGLDSGLDSVEYSVYQAQSEMAAASGDWDYGYSALKDESLRFSEST